MTVALQRPPTQTGCGAMPSVAEATDAARKMIGAAVEPPITREALVDEVDRTVGRTHRAIGDIREALKKQRAKDPAREQQIRELERAIAALVEWRRRNGDGLPNQGGKR